MRDIEVVLREKESQLEALNWEIEALRVAADILKDDGRADVVPMEKVAGLRIEEARDRVVSELENVVDFNTDKKGTTEIVRVQVAKTPQEAHISDLRVLIDKGEAREKVLLDLVKMVMEERYYKPTVTGPAKENKTTTALPAEHLSDVEAFDEKADQEQSDEQAALQKEMQDGLNELLTEHEEAHKE